MTIGSCRIVVLVAVMALAGCATSFTAVPAADTTVGPVTVTPEAGWNKVPPGFAPFARPGAQVWTKDGVLLDRFMLAPSIRAGETLFRAPANPRQRAQAALPEFRPDMLPNELVQFTESSLVKLLGEGSATVASSNLRPVTLGTERGIRFDLAVTPAEGPAYRGVAAGVVRKDKLSMLLFLAADPYYFDKHQPAVEALIASARF
ncbi:MAG: hypothetical protein JNM50_02810 [Chromatiales bacterium]|nr:hypothetical protein [Chromatiales bacterium]